MATGDTQVKSLTPEQRRALDALLTGADARGAAAAAGCSERTLLRWKTEPAFRRALQAAQDATLDAVTNDLVRAAGGAVALLRSVVEDEGAQKSHRLRAATALLDASLRWHELRSLSQRIAALEDALHETPATIDQVGASR